MVGQWTERERQKAALAMNLQMWINSMRRAGFISGDGIESDPNSETIIGILQLKDVGHFFAETETLQRMVDAIPARLKVFREYIHNCNRPGAPKLEDWTTYFE